MLLRDFLRDHVEPIEVANFFDAEFCQKCIEKSEGGTWQTSNYGSRKIQTCELNLDLLEEKLAEHVPSSIRGWQYSGIHPETCQFFKYTENDSFPNHQDQPIVYSAQLQSLLTLVVYLNTCQGGATGFPERGQSIQPELGKAVIFPQNFLHNSARIDGGFKYILRAQILYKNYGSFPY